jgi:hypothetical protein
VTVVDGILPLLRLASIGALLGLAAVGLFYGLRVYLKLKGEFGRGVRWITYGFHFIIASGVIAFPLVAAVPEGSPIRTLGEAILAPLFVGAFVMILIGYKKIYDLVSQIA